RGAAWCRQKDRLLARRRAGRTGAAPRGAGVVARALLPGTGDRAPSRAPPAAGARAARRPLRPSEYRLRPLTGYGPPRTTGGTPVRKEPLLRVNGRGRTMVLTFDDGPDPRYTPHILDTLARYDVRAMFFVCGEMASYNKELLARMAEDRKSVV